MAQKRYVLACIMVSFRYLQRKYELQPGIDPPALSSPFLNAAAIFMKNCAISERERLIFLPWSCSSLVLAWLPCGPMSWYSTLPSSWGTFLYSA